MADCPSTSELRDFVAERLAAADQVRVGGHVDQCAECQRALDLLVDAMNVGDVAAGGGRQPQDSKVLSMLIGRLRNQPPGSRSNDDGQVDPRAPLLFSDFELQSRLGSGGMGTVYHAIQKSLRKPVAVKVLEVGDQVERFIQEACAAASLRHANIVDVHGIGRTPDGGYFLVMDLVEGSDLQQWASCNRLDFEDIARIVSSIADAVDHAHRHGVIHRDLKPSNVMVAADGAVLVTDFGTAKLLGQPRQDLSRAFQAIGTPNYMAPEQAEAKWGEVRPATDVYGLGGLLYFLIAGQPPFPGDGLGVLAKVVSAEAPPPPRAFRRDVPPRLDEICMRCLSKQPSERYASAAEVARELRTPLADLVTDSPVADSVERPESKFNFEPPLGAVPLNSRIYLERSMDALFQDAIARRDSIVLVRGARQMGKTSLMARGLRLARDAGTHVVLTDFQKLNAADLESAESLFLAIGDWLADGLDLDVSPHDHWNARRSASVNFERFLRREILGRLARPLVWAVDEADRLFPCEFSSEVFGLFRSWHNERALDPSGPWFNLTLAIAYATEAHLFISDLNQSPFNVGTRIPLEDFSVAQVAEMNARYNHPLKTTDEVQRFVEVVGGQPYLVNRGLYEISINGWHIDDFESHALSDEGVFSDHLRRLVVLLAKEPRLRDATRGVLDGNKAPGTDEFYRLRSAGILSGDAPSDCRLRCKLYQTYLDEHIE